MGEAVTAREVLQELRRHVDRCETLNAATANAISSMAQSHRDLAEELKKTRENISARWDRLNNTAWKALGAIGLTLLAGIAGVVFQNYSIANNAAQTAAQQVSAAAPSKAERDARDTEILKQLAAIRKQTAP